MSSVAWRSRSSDCWTRGSPDFPPAPDCPDEPDCPEEPDCPDDPIAPKNPKTNCPAANSIANLTALAIVPRHLLHLALQFFGLAAQHFLLPALLGALRVVALLLGQIFLAARQLVEFLQRFVDFFLLLAGGAARGLRRLVLILFGVELEIEQAREVAPRSAARPASPARLPKAT